MKIDYIGLFDGKFNYRVELNGHTFSYFTGLGWSKQAKTNPDTTQYKALTPDEQDKVRQSLKTRHVYNNVYRQVPSESDILECLQSDVDAGNMSFSEFCDNLGYSNDSLKALDAYRACQDTAHKLRGFAFPKREEV